MDRLQTLAATLTDLAETATKAELDQALVLCLGFAETIGREEGDGREPVNKPIKINEFEARTPSKLQVN